MTGLSISKQGKLAFGYICDANELGISEDDNLGVDRSLGPVFYHLYRVDVHELKNRSAQLCDLARGLDNGNDNLCP